MNTKSMAISFTAALYMAGALQAASAPVSDALAARIAETPETRDERMAPWREARFGMFIHWGLFSASGGTWKGERTSYLGCLVQNDFAITHQEYRDTLMPKFTGEYFDAGAIAQLAVDAGMKYIIPITKHHEGFCLFDSKVTDYTITHTPAKRDWIRELTDASRRRGLMIGYYYSQQLDWSQPGGNGIWDPELVGDTDEYIENIVIPHVRELLTSYGDIDIMWFDGVVNKERANRIVGEVLELDHDIIINNRLGGDFYGDTRTPEQFVPLNGFPGRDWETCQTINDTWEYTHYDRNWKSVTTLVRELIDTASKGGNYLLNIGPKADGSIPQSTIDTLRAMGGWMDVHGESIYGTLATPFVEPLPWGRCTRKDLGNGTTRLYLHIFDWPFDSVLRIPALDNEVAGVSQLSIPGAGPLSYERDENGRILVQMPVGEPNDYATVVALDIKGETRVSGSHQIADILTLYGDAAVISGGSNTLHYNTREDSISNWSDPKDRVTWQVDVPKAGRYYLNVAYGCQPGHEGGEYAIEINGQTVTAKAEATASWRDRRPFRAGVADITEAGPVQVVLRTVKQENGPVFDFQRISLVPVE